MSRLTKIMLGLTIINVIATVLIMAGIINGSKFPRVDVVFPLAVIFYGMFLICRMFQKDVAEFDAEQSKHLEHQDHASPDKHSQSHESFHGHEHHEPMGA